MVKKIKVLTAKPGLDGHDRGIKVVNHVFRDSGYEVIYIGNAQPDEIVNAAVQEDVDIIGLSILSSSYKVLIPEFLELAKKSDLMHKMLLLGGIILPRDQDAYLKQGFTGVYGPGTNLKKVVEFINNSFQNQKGESDL